MSETRTSCGRFLILEAAAKQRPQLLDALRQLGEVHTAPTLTAAFEASAQQPFDLFVVDSSQLPSPEQFIRDRQLATLLETLGQAVCLMDLDGTVVWSNARFANLPPQVMDQIVHRCQRMDEDGRHEALARRARSWSVVCPNDQHFDARLTPIVEDSGRTRLMIVISDVTRARRLQEKIDAIDKAGREMVRLDEEQIGRMDPGERLDLLERKIIYYTRDLLHFDNFAIRLLDRKSGRLELLLHSGLLAEAEEIDIYALPDGNGIGGYVAATGRSYICPDVRNDDRYLIGIDNARSSLTVPLMLHDQVVGVFNIESDHLAAFREDDRQFAEIFGRYIAISLHILNLLAVEHHATTGRLADNVSAEIAAPLNEILGDATTLMEDYIGHDDLRHRLRAIADNVDQIRKVIKQVTQPVRESLARTPVKPTIDPVLQDKLVLIIDDEEIIRTTVRDVLAANGADVDTSRDGQEGLALFRQRPYDLVISDIKMPGSNGYEVFKGIKELRPDCPVMFITGFGYDPNHSIIRATPEGLAAVLYKPFKVDELLVEVRKAIRQHKE